MNKGIWIFALLGQMFRRGHDHVDRQHEFLANRQANGVAALWPVGEGFEDDEEVDVAVGAGVAAGVAAEEDNLFGIEFLGDQLGYGLNCRFVDRDFTHVDQTPPGHGLLTGYVRGPTIAQEAGQAFRCEVLFLAAAVPFGCVSARRPAVLLVTSQPTADWPPIWHPLKTGRVPVGFLPYYSGGGSRKSTCGRYDPGAMATGRR